MRHALIVAMPVAACSALPLCVFAVAAPAFAQGWEQQGPLPTGLDIHDVHMLSRDEAWIAADPGAVYHTVDGGITWEKRQLQTDSLWAVRFLDPAFGIAAGNGIFRTTDGGQTWTKVSPWGSLYQVQILDAQHAYAVGNGGTTYRSTDGGVTWAYSAVGPIDTMAGIFFVTPQTGWAVNIAGDIYKSTDGGASWQLNHHEAGGFTTIWFADANEGWATGGATYLHTVDGGQSWTRLGVPPGTSTNFTFHLDRNRSWAVGEGGQILATADGWQTSAIQVPAGAEERLWAASMADAGFGLAVGEEGRILAAGDGGAHWLDRNSGGMDVHGMDANDLTHAWAGLWRGDVTFTANGEFWETVRVAGFSVYGTVEDVDFAGDNLNGWATGTDLGFASDAGIISRSTNGGHSWAQQYAHLGQFLQDVEALDAATAVVGGNWFGVGGVILRTDNGGANWTIVKQGGPSIESMDFTDPLRGYAAGGAIQRSNDGGLTWTTQHVPLYSLADISFADRQNGWAVGWYGTLLHTDNGGQSWVSQAPPWLGFTWVGAVHAVDADTCWIAGGDNLVARTTDGGATWIKESIPRWPSYRAWTALAFVDADYGWIGGNPRVDEGGIWRRTGADLPGGFFHHGRLLRGQPVDFLVDGLQQGDVARFFYSLAGPGPGPCRAGLCLDILPPVVPLGSDGAGPEGTARLQLRVPPAAPILRAYFQAAVQGSAGSFTTNTTQAWIEP